MIYENPNNPLPSVEYLFSIINETEFSIQDAYGTNKVLIAEAHLTLHNAKNGQPYGVEVTFRDEERSQFFNLHLNGQHSLFPITYYLLFGGETVIAGVPLDWTELSSNTPNLRSIEVTGIQETLAELAPAGQYRDTI
ncbi:MAG: hypothetical protein ACQ5SW_00150, partial [Sphaerochaetaceae bacterium]